MNATLEQPQVNRAETKEQFLKRKFPISSGESHVRYCPVGGDNFRINFYTEKERDEPSFIKNYIIKRHYYVILAKDGASWKVVKSYDK